MIYVDSAAVVKLIRAEPFSLDLVDWLGARRAMPLAASSLVEVETYRALRRVAPEALGRIPSTLARLYRLEIDSMIRTIAASFHDSSLRSLDAIHLATASVLTDRLGALDAFVSYDTRLLTAAAEAGLPTVSPGM